MLGVNREWENVTKNKKNNSGPRFLLCDLYCAIQKGYIQHDMFCDLVFFFFAFFMCLVNLLNIFNLKLNAFLLPFRVICKMRHRPNGLICSF